MLKEFKVKEFAIKGNAINLAMAVSAASPRP